MKRRTFISAAAGLAAAGASSAQARKPAVSGRTLDGDFIRVGMLGLGPYSNAADYIRVINTQSVPPRTALRITSVWSRPEGYASSFRGTGASVEEQMKALAERNSIERFQWEYGVEHIVEEPEGMLDHVDAVFVTDPEDSVRLARPFLERGMPVFVDRPVAWSMNEVRSLVETARENNAVLVAGAHLPWMPEIQAMASRIDRNILQHYYIDSRVERFILDMPGVIETALNLSGGEVEVCNTNGFTGDDSSVSAELAPIMVHLTYRKLAPDREPVVGVISSWHGEPFSTWMKAHMNRRIIEQGVLDTPPDHPLERDEHLWLPMIRGIARAFETGTWPETESAIVSKVRVLLMAHMSGIRGGETITSSDVESHRLPSMII